MENQNKEIKINPRKLNNGTYYTKLNNIYIGILNEHELNHIQKEIKLLSEIMEPNELINYFRSLFVDKQRGFKISQGMKRTKYKQYNKKLEISTIKKIKEMANYFQITENEFITNCINESYNKFVLDHVTR